MSFPNMLTQQQLLSLPMEDCHKELVTRHYGRLMHILRERDEEAIGRYTDKRAACEQMAKMTILVRDYHQMHREGYLVDDEVESIVTYMVDVSFSGSGTQGMFAQRMFVSPLLSGTEHEVATLAQELMVEHVDDVEELWAANPPPRRMVLSDPDNDAGLGNELDWEWVLGRSRSDDDIVRRSQRTGRKIKDLERWRKQLVERRPKELNRNWPLVLTRSRLSLGHLPSRRTPAETETSWTYSQWQTPTMLPVDLGSDLDVQAVAAREPRGAGISC